MIPYKNVVFKNAYLNISLIQKTRTDISIRHSESYYNVKIIIFLLQALHLY